MNVISMISHRMTDVTMTSVSMARKDEAESLVFYEKLIGDGTAYIDTGYIASHNTNLDIYYQYISVPGGSGQTFWGYYTNNNFTLSGRSEWGGAYLQLGQYSQWGYTIPQAKALAFTRYQLIGNELYIDDVRLGTFSRRDATNAVSTLTIGRGRGYSSLSGVNVGMKFGEWKIYNDETLVMHLRPCMYFGEAGMYDVINNVFYGNANSDGELTVAND